MVRENDMWTLCRVLVRRAGLRALVRAVTPADRSGRSTLTIAERPPRAPGRYVGPLFVLWDAIRGMPCTEAACRGLHAFRGVAARWPQPRRCTAASRTVVRYFLCVALLRRVDQAPPAGGAERRATRGGSASARQVCGIARAAAAEAAPGAGVGAPPPSTAPHFLPPGPTRDGSGRGVRGGGGGGGTARGKGCGGGRAGARHTALEVGAVEVALHLAADRPGHPTEVAVERLLVEQLRRLRRTDGRG